MSQQPFAAKIQELKGMASAMLGEEIERGEDRLAQKFQRAIENVRADLSIIMKGARAIGRRCGEQTAITEILRQTAVALEENPNLLEAGAFEHVIDLHQIRHRHETRGRRELSALNGNFVAKQFGL